MEQIETNNGHAAVPGAASELRPERIQNDLLDGFMGLFALRTRKEKNRLGGSFLRGTATARLQRMAALPHWETSPDGTQLITTRSAEEVAS